MRVAAAETKIAVGILGATGTVGQRLITLLHDHPWFSIHTVAASKNSAGKTYGEAVHWVQSRSLPASVARLKVRACTPPVSCPLVFSALDASVAGDLEVEHARAGSLVVSNARSHRMDPDVPLLIPEVNPDHLQLLEQQSYGPGGLLTNPNCSTIGLVLCLKPLHDSFGLEALQAVTLQAVSGAGLPGVSAMEMVDNVIPFIDGEEEKMEQETRKILGRLQAGRLSLPEFPLSAQCNRVPVLDGHLICVSVGFKAKASRRDILAAWESFRGEPQDRNLPSAPAQPVHWRPEVDAPQPRLHRETEKGMAVSVGRLRRCPVLGYRFAVLSHNTMRGAAGGALLAAELAVARGHLHDRLAPAGES